VTTFKDDGTTPEAIWRPYDRTTECYQGGAKPLLSPTLLVVHRISLAAIEVPDELLDGPTLARKFRTHFELRPVTGGLVPYHFLVRWDGLVEQLLPLEVCGAHAKEANAKSWAVAVVGTTAANEAQQAGLLRVCRWLLGKRPLEIVGHTDIEGASSDPDKRCPWPVVDVEGLRARVLKSEALVVG
jgi:N-acetyl-anhydromuramyl-L-alanine amidase AmpD